MGGRPPSQNTAELHARCTRHGSTHAPGRPSRSPACAAASGRAAWPADRRPARRRPAPGHPVVLRREQDDAVRLGHDLVDDAAHRGRGADAARVRIRCRGCPRPASPAPPAHRGGRPTAAAVPRQDRGPRPGAGAGGIGCRERPQSGEQGVQGGTEATHVVRRSQLGAWQCETELQAAVGVEPHPLRVVAAQHVAVPVRRFGGGRQRLQGAGRGQRLEHAVRDGLGEAAAGYPLGDGSAQYPVRQAGSAGGEHVQQSCAAGMLEAARPQRSRDDVLGAAGAPSSSGSVPAPKRRSTVAATSRRNTVSSARQNSAPAAASEPTRLPSRYRPASREPAAVAVSVWPSESAAGPGCAGTNGADSTSRGSV